MHPSFENQILLLPTLREQKQMGMKGGIYHRTQIDLTYNSNHIEGSRLTHEQPRYIYETNTVGVEGEVLRVDDIIETSNHFRCIDWVIDHVEDDLTPAGIKELHRILKTGTSDSRKEWFAVGEYKRLPNEVGGRDTCPPEKVEETLALLLQRYATLAKPRLVDLLDFHVQFERIHPFQDGNGRVGRLILFKECLKYGEVPFIISDDLKFYYYRGLAEWGHTNAFLTDTCLTAQDRYKSLLDYFRIAY